MHGKLVLTREVGECIGGRKIEHRFRWPHDLPFHFSHGGDARAIFHDRLADAAIGGEVRQINGRAVRGGFGRGFFLRGRGRAGRTALLS